MEMSKEEEEEIKEEIAIIIRQTSYSKEEALELLKKHGSIEEVIKEYLGIKKKTEHAVSTNQGIFKSIRNFL